MKKFNIYLAIFLSLAASRLIPHPPNFTSLIALSFYVPAFLGIRYLPFVLLSFVITDLLIGMHDTIFFTWGSVIVIGLLSKYFTQSIYQRIFGALGVVFLFFLITNYGVWLAGMYQPNFEGLIEAYTMGLPFFGYSLISTLIFGSLIETIYKLIKFNFSAFNK